MISVLRKATAALALAAAAAMCSVVTAGSAQAVPAPVTTCGPSVQAGTTGLYLQTCATRDGIAVTGRTTITNKALVSRYVAELQIKVNWGASGYSVCPVNSWLAPNVSGSCTDPVTSITNQPSYYIGWGMYWDGVQYQWVNANSPTI